MSDNYYGDLREFIEVLDDQGLLYRWQRLVNKDSELMPLMRLQYRGRSDAERQAFLYENVTDGKGRRYGIRVLTGVYAASRRIVGLGMGCKYPGDIYERWRRAVDKPVDPVVDSSRGRSGCRSWRERPGPPSERHWGPCGPTTASGA